jgi:hypothetical protein
MRIVSQKECEDWLKANLRKVFTRETMRVTLEAEYENRVTYHLPAEVTKMTALAHMVSHYAIDTKQPGIFWVTDWGIFPSVENMAIFDGYRRSLGENRPLLASPGHVFDQSKLKELECLLSLALYFCWDATLFDGAGTEAFVISHDEWCSVHAKDEESLRQFEGNLRKLELKRLG